MSDIKSVTSQAEKIGAIGSPSSTTEIALDILGTAASKKLVGELAYFSFLQDGITNYAMGQITEIQLRNLWLEDATMRSLARQRGQVNPISGQQDTHLGQMIISAVFGEEDSGFVPSILGTVPSTGTYANIATDKFLDALLEKYKDEIFYLGKVYGSTPKLPLWFKHFGSGKNGAGEAYHIGIFGKTGSGKSVLAKMILSGYARHKNMSIFVIDPQGEFTKDCRGTASSGGFSINLKEQIEKLGKEILTKNVSELVLDRWDLFVEIMTQCSLFDTLSVPTIDKRKLALEEIRTQLEKEKITLDSLYKRETFNKFWDILGVERTMTIIYSSDASRRRLRDRYMEESTEENKKVIYQDCWLPICRLFTNDPTIRPGAVKIDGLLYKVFTDDISHKPVVIIDLSKESASGLFWNDTIKSMVIKRFLDGINRIAEQKYEKNSDLNTLVIIDEAHRLAPRERLDNELDNEVRRKLEDAVRTTRKYGLGWMFISQTLSSLSKEIINQMRIMFFGFGLALGTEYMALRELAGGDQNSLKLYQSFRDPHSSFDVSSRQYSFMSIGPVSPLSFSGTPLFFTAFNKPEDFISANKLET